MRSRWVSPAMAMSRGLPEVLERRVFMERPHIVLLREDEENGYYYLVLVSVWNFD